MGTFANKPWVKTFAWIAAAMIVVLNARLVVSTLSNWISNAGDMAIILWCTVIPLIVGIFILLFYISIPTSWRRRKPTMPSEIEQLIVPPRFANIGVALDLGAMDPKVLSHAQSLALQNGARLVLLHIVEGVGGQIFGREADDDEARDDREHLEKHAEQLRNTGLEVQAVLGFGRVPKEIIRISKEQKIDLLIMGGHGHRGMKDILFGTSISKVRHGLKIPVLVIQ
jgi:manganese transport protein